VLHCAVLIAVYRCTAGRSEVKKFDISHMQLRAVAKRWSREDKTASARAQRSRH